MKFLDYLQDKAVSCVLFIGTVILTGMFQAILLVEMPVIILTELPFLTVGVLLLVLDFYRKKKYYTQLVETMEEIDEKSYVADIVKEPRFQEGKVTHLILKQMGREMNEQVLKRNIELEEYKNYMETWVHEVKLPVSTAKLMIANYKNEVTLNIEKEIDNIDNYVEQVLYYARSENVEKDYHMNWFDLRSLVYESVKKYSRDFIQAQVHLEIGEMDYAVLSDRKWVAFILGQIIQNAIKYRRENSCVHFCAKKSEEQVILQIEDNGIGINPEDVSRVFDKGFTGGNVRAHSNATGIGLYLCRKLCQKLGLSIDIESELGEWTRVELSFPKSRYEMKENITKV